MPNNSLRPLREKKGLTLAQLAGKTSISIRTLQMYEVGERAISADDLRKLSRVLLASTAELLQPSEDLPPPPPRPVEPPPVRVAPPIQAISPTAAAPTPIIRPLSERLVESDGERQVATSPGEFVRRPFPSSAQPPAHGEFRRGFGGGPPAPRPSAPRPPRPPREPRAPRPVGPATKGQLDQIHNLARRMGIGEPEVEERIGSPLTSLDHLSARNAIAKLRQEMEDSGTWQPRVGEGADQEGTYLGKLRDKSVDVQVVLINGERVEGIVSSYTPYVIQLRRPDGDEVTVRKLAIAYYQTKGAVDDAE